MDTKTFQDLGLTTPVLDALRAEGYTVPTPIQAKAVPHVLAGRDLFGCAQTGTGKTAAFALPLIERMLAQPRERSARRCRVLVLAPTRELAGQIHESFRTYGRNTRLVSAVVYGGVSQLPQEKAMARGVDVLVATPGRLLDLVNQRCVDLRGVEFLVLDEADRMLDMGFIHDVRRIVGTLPRERQTLFFSATLPDEVRRLADSMLRDPLEVKTAPQATPAETVDQSVFFLPQRQKRQLLVHLLTSAEMGRVIVFTRTKHGANKLQRDLDKAGIEAAAIHGNKSQAQREKALAAFKSPRPPVLIATDIAARGIDVDRVSHVVNYELPHEPETYVHRIGRTGRAGNVGAAVSFCDHEERPRLKAIERLLRKPIPVRGDLPDLPAVERGTEERQEANGRGGRSGRSGRAGGRRSGGRADSERRSRPRGRQAERREERQDRRPQSAGGSTATASATATAPRVRKYRRAL
ncbi:MAG: DEAD/DEAH box helicase [Planctomycetia bacterium]|nr:DEAD/DEAH box helicase [Planctomycetia bacterium]